MARTVDWVIQKAFLEAQRKSTAPTSGTSKYNALLGIVDNKQLEWASEPSVEWDSLYSVVTLAAVVSATDTFALTGTINYISKREGNPILITNGTNTSRFMLVSPNQLDEYRYDDACAQVGSNLVFSKAFSASSSLIGYNIKVPSMLYPTDITSGSQNVQVDDPLWLVYMVAADFVRNDVVKRDNYDLLLQMAAERMAKMKQANGGQQAAVATPWAPTGETWL
jgi:hypothetical protein